MRYLNIAIQLILAYYIGKFVAGQTLLREGYIFIIFLCIGFFYFFFLSLEKRFFIFILTVFISFVIPTGKIPLTYVRDLIAPLLAFSILLQLLTKGEPLFSRRASLFFSAVGILALWAMINYIKRPVLGQITFGVSETQGGLQAYYIIFAGITTFLCGFWFFKYKSLNIDRLLFVLLLIAIIAGNLRMIGYFTGFSIPFLGGSFEGGGLWFERVSTDHLERKAYYAIGGLKQVAVVGFSALGAILYKRRWNLFYIIVFINLLVLTVFSGGRAPFLGIAFAVFMYILFINRRLIIPFIFIFIIPLIIGTTYLNIEISQVPQSKFGRVLYFKGGLKKQYPERYYTYLYMWEVFKESPILGKGIGYQPVMDEEFFKKYPEAEEVRKSIEEMTMSGSHGSYASILALLGIGGAFWFVTMLYGGIFYAYRLIKKGGDYSRLAVFAFLNLSMASVHLIVGMAGYDVSELWFLPGMIGGLMARQGDVEHRIVEKEKEYQGERLLWAED